MSCFSFFFFNDTATTEIYTLSLHDALPIYRYSESSGYIACSPSLASLLTVIGAAITPDRKSTRLNSSHLVISYAVFCLKKKKKRHPTYATQHCHPLTTNRYLSQRLMHTPLL